MKNYLLYCLCVFQVSCGAQHISKINGVSFVASREEVTQTEVSEVLEVQANHAAVMPFGFIRDATNPEIIFNTERQWFGETKEGSRQYIQRLQDNGIQVMLKPQLWIRGGVFTGSFGMESEEDWQLFENSYREFLLTYTQLARETGVSILCIGTELETFVQERPEFWKDLIARVRNIYDGQLTYAANWDEYKDVPFWNDLDYIGVDAYFPLSEDKTPSIKTLKKAWIPWKNELESLSDLMGKPVLFTEFGYRSTDFTALRPWSADRNEAPVNLKAQANAINSLLTVFWREDWFMGGYVWKWFTNHAEVGGPGCNRFTPQNKPAQKVISAAYSRY